MKSPNLKIIGIEQGKDAQIKCDQNIFDKIIDEKFLNLKKDMRMKLQEAYRTPNRLDKRNSPFHRIIKIPHIKIKEEILRTGKDKSQVTYKGRPGRIIPDFSMETLKVKKSSIDIL